MWARRDVHVKLLYISSLYPPDVGGGAELVLETQVNAMSARGHDVTVLTIGNDPNVTVSTSGAVTIIRAPYRNRYFHLRSEAPSLVQKSLWHIKDRDNADAGEMARGLIRQISPDLACCHNITGWSISIWRELRALQIPIVQVLHDQYLLCIKSTMFRSGKNCSTPCLDCKLMRMGHARASNQVKAVIGVSDYILNKLTAADYFSTVKIRKVLNNVSTGPLPPIGRNRIRGNDLVIGYIGSLNDNKGIRFLLETIRTSNLSGFRLLVAGRGEANYEKILRATFVDPRIEFLGYTARDDFFNSIDLTVVPSLWNDTFPSVVFESLGHGVPVVASRRGGIPEMITDGETGFLFEPDDEDSLLSVLSGIVRRPERLSGLYEKCRESAGKYFDLNAWVLAQESIFAQCLGPDS